MKLRNKKTGEIRDGEDVILENLRKNGTTLEAICIDEIKEEWEDYEEPKRHWIINSNGEIEIEEYDGTDFDKECKAIGNYFETYEEAEKAVEKLKAWKRLKDRGFKLDAVVDSFFCLDIYMKGKYYEEIKEDLKIVFGGDE